MSSCLRCVVTYLLSVHFDRECEVEYRERLQSKIVVSSFDVQRCAHHVDVLHLAFSA